MTVAATPRMAVPATMGTATGTASKLPQPHAGRGSGGRPPLRLVHFRLAARVDERPAHL